MTAEELQDQVDLLAKSKAELETKLKAVADENQKLKSDFASVDEKIKAAIPKDYEDLKKQVSSFEPLKKENEQLKHQMVLNELQAKYPDVSFELVPAGTKEQMESHAAKLQAMVDAKVSKLPKKEEAKPGERWNGVPPIGGVDQDLQLPKLEEGQIKENLKKAQASGDFKGVMEACMAGQPKATAALLATLK